jgi:hypothetical protein
MVLLTFSFQPLAAALLLVKDTWWTLPGMPVPSHNSFTGYTLIFRLQCQQLGFDRVEPGFVFLGFNRCADQNLYCIPTDPPLQSLLQQPDMPLRAYSTTSATPISFTTIIQWDPLLYVHLIYSLRRSILSFPFNSSRGTKSQMVPFGPTQPPSKATRDVSKVKSQ